MPTEIPHSRPFSHANLISSHGTSSRNFRLGMRRMGGSWRALRLKASRIDLRAAMMGDAMGKLAHVTRTRLVFEVGLVPPRHIRATHPDRISKQHWPHVAVWTPQEWFWGFGPFGVGGPVGLTQVAEQLVFGKKGRQAKPTLKLRHGPTAAKNGPAFPRAICGNNVFLMSPYARERWLTAQV